jgi:hypothetical protein
MRSRILPFLVLAVVIALAGAYLGWSTNTTKAAGQPSVTTPAGSPPGPARQRTSGPGPARSPAAPPTGTLPQAAPPKAAPKAAPPKASPPKGPTPKACSPTAAAQPAAHTKWSKPPPPAADQVYFGQLSITSFDNSARTSISPDYQALTTTFDNFTIEVQKGRECDVTRSLSMRLPVTGPAQAAKLGFYVQGTAIADQGASARLTIRANGRVKVKSFPAGFADTYIHWLEFPVTPGATYTVSVQLEVHQNPDTGGYATLNMTSIDSSIT